MKICTIIGAIFSQFIKSAVVSKSILSFNKIEEIMIHTGQHFDKNMSNVFFDENGNEKTRLQFRNKFFIERRYGWKAIRGFREDSERNQAGLCTCLWRY